MDDWVLELVLRDRLHEPVVPWPEMNLDEPREVQFAGLPADHGLTTLLRPR